MVVVGEIHHCGRWADRRRLVHASRSVERAAIAQRGDGQRGDEKGEYLDFTGTEFIQDDNSVIQSE